jgi:hypothetical protein
MGPKGEPDTKMNWSTDRRPWDKLNSTQLNMFQLAFTSATDKMGRSFLSSRGSSTYPWNTVGGRMSDKNMEQRLNFEFCVKTGKSTSETLALQTLAYDEYVMKKPSVLKWHRRWRKDEKMYKMTEEVGNQKCKGQMQAWTKYEHWCAQIDA